MAPDQTDILTTDSRLDEFLNALPPLSTLGSVAHRILQLLAENLEPTEKLKTIVQYDPALTAALLSAAATHPDKPLTVPQAWQGLPLAKLLSALLSTAVAGIELQPHHTRAPGSLNRTQLWRHCLAVALICRAAAQHLNTHSADQSDSPATAPDHSLNPDLAYTAGLLHDLGKIVLAQALPKSLTRASHLATSAGQDILDAERRVFNFDHTILAQRIAQNLRLPAVLTKCIWLHHLPASMLPEQSYLPLVVFADTFARQHSLGESGNPHLTATAEELAELFHLTPDFLAELSLRIPEQLDDADRALALDDPPQPEKSIQLLARLTAELAGLHTQLDTIKDELTHRSTQLAQAEELSQRFAQIARQAADKIDRKTLDAQLAQIAAGAAHELNNPLAVISGRSQILAQQETDLEKKQTLELIEKQARHASDIPSELLAAVQPPTPSPVPTNLVPIIRKLAAALAGKAQTTNSHVDCELPDKLHNAFIDPQMFEQSLLEVLKNALDALAEKPGTIRIRCQEDDLQEKITLEVADSGIGMDPAVARNAFLPFFSFAQAGRARGLGLTRAKALTEANQGRLWLRSQPGRGTTVWMTMPLAMDRS